MKRNGLRFVRAYKVVMLPSDLSTILNNHMNYGGWHIRFGQIVNHKHWQPKQKVPKGAILMMLNVPLWWVDDVDDANITNNMVNEQTRTVRILWAVKVIPSSGHSQTNMMYGLGRVFWGEDGKCYSTKSRVSDGDRARAKTDRERIPPAIHEWQNKQRLDAQVGGAISYKPDLTVRMHRPNKSPQGMTVQAHVKKNR